MKSSVLLVFLAVGIGAACDGRPDLSGPLAADAERMLGRAPDPDCGEMEIPPPMFMTVNALRWCVLDPDSLEMVAIGSNGRVYMIDRRWASDSAGARRSTAIRDSLVAALGWPTSAGVDEHGDSGATWASDSVGVTWHREKGEGGNYQVSFTTSDLFRGPGE